MAKRKQKIRRNVLSNEPQSVNQEVWYQSVNEEVWYYEQPEGLCVVDYMVHDRRKLQPRSEPAFAILPWRMVVASVERYKRTTEKERKRNG